MANLRRIFGAAAIIAVAGIIGSCITAANASAKPLTLTQAKKDLLTLSDLPSGWTKERGPITQQGAYPAGSIAQCIGASSTAPINYPPETDSPFYQNGDGSLEVQDSITLFSSSSQAAAAFAALKSPMTPSCMATLEAEKFKSQIQSKVPKGGSVGNITGSMLPPVFGGRSTGYVLTIPVTYQGANFTLRIYTVFLVRNNLGQQITVNAYGRNVPPSLAQHLSSTAYARL